MAAIQSLAASNRYFEVSQKALATGKKVATGQDNGAIWAIANKLGADAASYDRVRESADRAGAIVTTAIAAGEGIMELLNEMKGKALAARQTGLSAGTQAALNADFLQLRSQINSVVANASFDGANMISLTPTNAVSLGDASGANGVNVNGAFLGVAGSALIPAGNIIRLSSDPTTGQNLATAAAAATALTAVNSSINNLGTQLATWGAGAKRIEVHKEFVSKLQDALNNGISSLVDADMTKESAKLTSLQTKQQLSAQALSISNSGPRTALALIR